jgi:hypothetical protein
MWQVSLLVANADKLPKTVQDSLALPLRPDEAAKAVLTK